MKISVIGCGYLGAVHAAAMAKLGHDVVGIDIVPATIQALSSGRAAIYEPGLDELLQEGLSSGKLRFTTDFSAAAGAEAHFIGVGTPQLPGGTGADLSYLNSAVASLAPYLAEGDVLIGKSTVPVGTAQALEEDPALRERGVVVAWNPEFLREGHAIDDTIAPDRLVYGLSADSARAARARSVLDEVYASILERDTPLVVTDYPTAELVKISANAFLATKISFINAVAQIADVSGADITALADAMGHDARIGRRFLNAGIGFGGGCLPKDIRAFTARAQELGVGEALEFLETVDEINQRQRRRVVEMVRESFPNPHTTTVAVLGLAFKPHSDDLRDSPALEIAGRLASLGYTVQAADPQAVDKARAVQPILRYAGDMAEAVRGADVVLLLTEWPDYVQGPVPQASDERSMVIDGRNALDGERWREKGWRYRGIGRR